MRFFRKLIQYQKRKKILEERNFYRNMKGGFVHPHLMAVVSRKELMNMSEEDFKIITH